MLGCVFCNAGTFDEGGTAGGWLALSTSASLGNEEEDDEAAAAGLPHAGLDTFSLAGC